MPYTRTTWVNNSAPDINAANLNNIELGVVAAPYGPDASANFVPVWNGSAWTYSGVKNAHVDAAAAIAYSKLNLATSIVNGDISGSAAIAYSKLNLATSILNADVATGAAIAVAKLAAGSNGQVLQTTAGVPTWGAAAGQTTYRKDTVKTVNTTVAETDLLNSEITVAANAIGASGQLTLIARGDWLLNNGAGLVWPRIKAKFGATTLFDTGTLTNQTAASATRFPWRVCLEIKNTGATNSQEANLHFEAVVVANSVNQQAALTTGEGIYVGGLGTTTGLTVADGFNTSAVDTTASQALALTVTLPSSSANVEMKLYGALVTII